MKIGVLALQGGVIEHLNHLKALGIEDVEVKTLSDLENLDGLILPGGESTTMGKILVQRNLLEPLKKKILEGLPVWGTCAGMILLAKELEGDTYSHLSTMDIKVKRNAYGSQLDSFTTNVLIKEVSTESIPLVFIRAPYIVEIGANVIVILEVDGDIVAAKEKNMLVTSFHPELTDNLEFHKYFIEMCKGSVLEKH